MSELGDTIRTLREQRSLSQRELGRRAGVSGSTISLIESGQTDNPNIETLRNIATILGVSEHFILKKAGILPSDDQGTEVPSELADIIAEAELLRGTPIYHQAMRLLRETLILALYKIDPPADPDSGNHE